MRTLHADLTTAQQSASATPYMKLVFHSRDRATTRTYETDDATNRIVQVQQAEGRYGSYALADGRGFVVSSIIRLQNGDNALSNLDFKGYRVYIEWGFNTGSGNRASRAGPEFVISQEFVSSEGINYLELYTLNLWELANQHFVNVGNVVSMSYTAGGANSTKVSHILMQLLGGGLLGSVQQQDYVDGGGGDAWTDFTSEAKETGDVVDMFPAVPATNDACYFGKTTKFDRLSIDLTQTISSGSIGHDWEYSRGSGVWSALSALTEAEGATANGHISLINTGIIVEAFDMPSDWATDTVNGVASMYWVRLRITSASSPVTQIQATLIFGGQDFAFALDTSEGTQGDDYLPTYSTHVGSQLGPVVSDIIGYTLMGLRLREDGFHALFVDAAQASPDATYILTAGPHTFFIHTEGQQVTIPNRIVVVEANLDLGGATYSGQDDDATAQGEIGIIPQVVVSPEIGSDAAAVTLATRIMTQIKRDKVQGRAEVPMHCGQEVWDEVRVQDDRTGNTVDGRVSQVIRQYTAGVYTMQVILGGDVWGVVIPPYPVPQLSERAAAAEEALSARALPPGAPLQPSQPLAVPVPIPSVQPDPDDPPVVPHWERVPGRAPTPPPQTAKPSQAPAPTPIPLDEDLDPDRFRTPGLGLQGSVPQPPVTRRRRRR